MPYSVVQEAADALNGMQQAVTDAWNTATDTIGSFINDFTSDYSSIPPLLSTADELGVIAGSYDIYECKDAAKAMADYLTKKGFEFNFISINYPNKPGYIVSIMYNDKVISENGLHMGICFNGNVYCNVHPYGLPKNMWIDDFDGVGMKVILEWNLKF